MKRNFCSAKRNETKFRIFLFRETSEIFAKQARLSYRFVFCEIEKKRKLKTLLPGGGLVKTMTSLPMVVVKSCCPTTVSVIRTGPELCCSRSMMVEDGRTIAEVEPRTEAELTSRKGGPSSVELLQSCAVTEKKRKELRQERKIWQ